MFADDSIKSNTLIAVTKVPHNYSVKNLEEFINENEKNWKVKTSQL